MYIGAALLCQAYIAPLSLFLALMPGLCQILKTLRTSKALILTTRLIMQKLGKQLEMMRVGSVALAQAEVPERITRRVPDQLSKSVQALRGLLSTGMCLAFIVIEYFCLKFFDLLFLIYGLLFKSGG